MGAQYVVGDQLMQVAFELVPKANHRVRGGKHGFYNDPSYTEYKSTLTGYFQAWLMDHIDRHGDWTFPIARDLGLSVQFFRPTAHRVDLDNLVKPVKDALTKSGIIKDDSQIKKYVDPFELVVKAPKPMVVIGLFELERKYCNANLCELCCWPLCYWCLWGSECLY